MNDGRAPTPGGTLEVGERVLLVDEKDRRYLIVLTPGGSFQSHVGVVDHDAIIGGPEGVYLTTRRREGSEAPPRRVLVLRPTLSDLIVRMPRGAQVIYPKDLGAILFAADLYPGARVLEAGVGSGALSMAALRAGCSVVGYEIRPDFANRARANVASLLGASAQYDVRLQDVYEGIDESGLDRVLLDLPEPWRVVGHAEAALRPGGILLGYLPTINQTAALRAELSRHRFALAATVEILERSWHIEGRSVRPDHRMVAHTGFLTSARRIVEPGGNEAPASSDEGGQASADFGFEAGSDDPEELRA